MASSEHPLRRYLVEEKILAKDLASRAGVSPQRICDVLNGRLRRFTPEAAKRISKATGGKVQFEELLFWVPKPKRRSAS